MLHHAVRIDAKPGLSLAFGFETRPDVHSRRIPPQEERLVLFLGALHEVDRGIRDFLIDRLHALLRERSGIQNSSVRIGMENAAGAEPLPECRSFG